MTQNSIFRERLWPTIWLYIIFLLLIPGVMLMLMPLNATLGVILAPVVYALIVGFITFSCPVVTVTDGTLIAGNASIPLNELGNVDLLDRNELTLTIGPRADARAFLLIRGWIHTAVKIENNDPQDPAPYWVITTRRPKELQAAITRSQN
ncbi:MAG: DUF3093 domain-containing protein [Canibacter sp.]